MSSPTRIEQTQYKGWKNCYFVSNGEVELVVTGDVGPRVIRFSFAGGQNLFKNYEEQMGGSGEETWRIRGGSRLWMAPEDPVASYALDNAPVRIESADGVLTSTGPVLSTGLEMRMEIRMAGVGTSVEVVHRVRNAGLLPVELAPWALTVMAPGGVGITGFPPRGTHPEDLAPANPLVMWSFTDLSDARWIFMNKYLALRQDSSSVRPQKIGHFNSRTWGAYLLDGELFLKRSVGIAGRAYPDFNCSFEMFTNADMLELETLGPLTRLAAGQTVEHTEKWSLHRDVRIGEITEAALDAALLPLLAGAAQ